MSRNWELLGCPRLIDGQCIVTAERHLVTCNLSYSTSSAFAHWNWELNPFITSGCLIHFLFYQHYYWIIGFAWKLCGCFYRNLSLRPWAIRFGWLCLRGCLKVAGPDHVGADLPSWIFGSGSCFKLNDRSSKWATAAFGDHLDLWQISSCLIRF